MTLCRHGDGWLSFLDGALSIDALRVFSPQAYGPPVPY
jgi:hypothetical protein